MVDPAWTRVGCHTHSKTAPHLGHLARMEGEADGEIHIRFRDCPFSILRHTVTSEEIAKWDRWAPTVYLFIIGLVVGYVMGFASGILSGGSTAFWALTVPVIVIVIAFVAFFFMARTIGKRP